MPPPHVCVAICLWLSPWALSTIVAMLIPGDTEILPGYVMDEPNIQLDGAGVFYEMRSLTGDDRIPIRNRRAISSTVPYRVLSSPGLRSHFTTEQRPWPSAAVVVKKVLHAEQSSLHQPSSNDDYMQNIAYVNLRPPPRNDRRTRSVETMDVPAVQKTDQSAELQTDETEAVELDSPESLPLPSRLTVLPEEYSADQNEAASTLMDSWHDGTYLYAKSREHHSSSDDFQPPPLPAASASNEGIRGRMPRVHFITQKSQPDDKALPPLTSLAGLSSGASKSLRSAPQKRDDRYGYSLGSTDYHHGFMDDMYDHRSFDGYDREMLLQPDTYLRSAYPDYAAPTRAPTYADYFYSERRFDLPPPPSPLPPLPLYRDASLPRTVYYPDDRYLPSSGASSVDMRPPRNRRIIYYATLPEIVRAPVPTVAPLDTAARYRNGYGSSRYDYLPSGGGNGYEYDRYYRSVRAEKPLSGGSSAAAAASAAAVAKDAALRNKLNKKQFLDGSVRIASGLTVNDAPNGKSTAKPTAAGATATRRPTEYGRYY